MRLFIENITYLVIINASNILGRNTVSEIKRL